MRSPLLGCVADDHTGGTDVAAALRRAGLRTVLRFGPPPPDTAVPECDAVVVALKTRSLPPREAVARSLAARDRLAGLGVRRFYVKYCSTFDSTDQGNIGPVIDAVTDASGAVTATGPTVVCPASPEHGRTVYQGHLFVGDRLLSESPMRHHPLTPMTDSDLVRVLGRQTPHRVAPVPYPIVARGAEAVRAALDELAAQGVRYAVTDALEDRDLDAIARATAHLPVITGAAGLARAVGALSLRPIEPSAALAGEPSDVERALSREAADARRALSREAAGVPAREPAGSLPVLPRGPGVVIAGSCSAATLEQVALARRHLPSYRLRVGSGEEALRWLEARLGAGEHAMVYSSAPPEERSPASGEALERALAAVAVRAARLGARRVVVAGGETSGAVVTALGVTEAVVGAEADRGVPWLLTTGDPALALLLKSGNFGRPDLLVRALEMT